MSGQSGFEWAVNEKCAMESGIGLSAVGRRSCLVMKHNGLNIALDPLCNAALHTTGAAVLLVVGDDPDAGSSTSVHDSRMLAEVARIPVIEPALDGDADEAVRLGVEISERFATPVILRVTAHLHEDCPSATNTVVQVGQSRPRARLGTSAGRDTVAHELTKLGRVQRHRLVTMPGVQAAMESARCVSVRCAAACTDAVITVGSVTRLVPTTEGRCRMTVRAGWPVPAAVVDFAQRHHTVLLVEEPAPVVERYLHARLGVGVDVTLVGRLTGHLPPEGALSAELVAHAAAGPYLDRWQVPDRKHAVPPLARYDTLFRAIAGIRQDGVFVAADVGSSVRLCYPPYSACDVALCLGSAVSVASGAARAGRRAVAVTGDFALFHSGLEPLLETARRRLPVLITVLANGVQAQTGGQPVPELDLAAVATACGIGRVDGWRLDDLDGDATDQRLRGLLRGPLPALALVSCRPR
jgi:indolepyruvate ferredoxin oxidoreductase alpha subunit